MTTRKAGRERPEQNPARKAADVCYRQLAVRARTRDELRKALARKGIEDIVAAEVLDKFTRAGLIDDTQFAESWVRSRHANAGLGRRALRAELLRKGIEPEIADEAVSGIESDDEETRARELVRKRVPNLAHVEETKAVRRLVGMLWRRGYPEGLAYRVVREELAAAHRETMLLNDARESV